MGTLPKLPEWLPEPVREYVEQPSREPSDLMVRLATDQRMRSVWETLKKHAKEHAISDYLLVMGFFCSALSYIHYWKCLERDGLLLPTGERRQLDQKIRETIDNLIHLLGEKHLKEERLKRTDEIAGVIPGIPGAIQDLYALRDKIERESVFSEHLPTKIRGDTAMRSFFMRVMKDFVLSVLDQPLHQAIADITNVVFDTDDDVTPAHVRKA